MPAVILLLSTMVLMSCEKQTTRVVIMADEDIIFKCPADTINGKIYSCDSTVFALKKHSLLKLYGQLRDCKAKDSLQKGK